MKKSKNNKKGFRLSLRARVFLATSLLLIVALGAIVVPTIQVGKEVASRSVDDAIANSLALQHYFRDLNNRELLIVLDGFANDPNFSAYVAAAVDTPEGEMHDLASIEDLILERKQDAELDFIMLLDPQGKVIIHSDSPAMTGRDISKKLFIAPVIEELTEATGIWIEQDQMYQAAIMPISLDYDLIGFVVTGISITKDLANEMKRVGGGDTLFMIAKGDQLLNVASTYDVAESTNLVGLLKNDILDALASSTSGGKISFELAGETWSVQVVPLAAIENQQIPLFLSFSSESKYMEGYERIFNIILIVAVITIAVSIILSLLLTSGILTPIKRLASASNLAAKGEYNTQVGLAGNDELAKLSNSIDSLLSDLRDKEDMQNYITELSKILPEETPSSPIIDADQKLPVELGEFALLTVDVNDLIDPNAQPKDAIQKLQKLNDIIVGQSEISDGLLIRLGNGVYVVAFSEEKKELRAFSTAGGIDKEFNDGKFISGQIGAKYCISSGQCYVGNIVANYAWQRVIVGRPVRQAIRLLEESGVNTILATNAVYQMIKNPFKNASIAIKGMKGKVSGKTLCKLDLSAAHNYLMPLTPEQTQLRQTLVSHRVKRQSVFDLATGSVFAERYEIISSLGKGSMGLVFKAMDRELQEPVAIKILRKEIAEDEEHLERLRSEIKLARRVTHPNILRTYDLGKVDETPFLSMEYVRGMTLRYLIDNSGRLPYSAALRVTRQLCDGMASVHELGILHRDIKAENVMLEPSGNLKLMDFGIARTIKKSEMDKLDEGLFIGTPSYASPEQIQGAELGVASDIYSLGILINEIFTGKLPIQGNDVKEICLSHVKDQPIAPSELWSDIPDELEVIILKCLQKRPGDRYSSIQQLMNDLDVLSA